jgi:hypothetical protein
MLELKKEFDGHRNGWKEIQIEKNIRLFQDFIIASERKDPPVITEIHDKIIADQQVVLKERQDVFDQVKTFRPPDIGKNKVKLFPYNPDMENQILRRLYLT